MRSPPKAWLGCAKRPRSYEETTRSGTRCCEVSGTGCDRRGTKDGKQPGGPVCPSRPIRLAATSIPHPSRQNKRLLRNSTIWFVLLFLAFSSWGAFPRVSGDPTTPPSQEDKGGGSPQPRSCAPTKGKKGAVFMETGPPSGPLPLQQPQPFV